MTKSVYNWNKLPIEPIKEQNTPDNTLDIQELKTDDHIDYDEVINHLLKRTEDEDQTEDEDEEENKLTPGANLLYAGFLLGILVIGILLLIDGLSKFNLLGITPLLLSLTVSSGIVIGILTLVFQRSED
jgi:Ca2+/Na+ antiporter